MHSNNIQLAMGIGNYYLSIALIYLIQAREITKLLKFQTPKEKKIS